MSTLEDYKEIVVTSEYVQTLLHLIEKYPDGNNVPEILYYEVFYTLVSLEKSGTMEEVRNIMGVWLNSVSTDTLTNESVHKIEKSRPKGRKMIVEESVERGLGYYFASRFQFFIGVSLLTLFSIGLDVFRDNLIMGEPLKDFSEALIVLMKLLMTVILFIKLLSVLFDLMYIEIGGLREVCDGLGIFTTDAKLSTEMMDKTVGALTVQQRLTYLEETAGKHFTKSIEKIDKYSKEWYEAIARAELCVMEKKHEDTKEAEE